MPDRIQTQHPLVAVLVCFEMVASPFIMILPLQYAGEILSNHLAFFDSSSAARFSLSSSLIATMTYAISTTFAVTAAVAPAHVELPVS